MSKVFKTLSGNIVDITDETTVDTKEDILSGEVLEYIVEDIEHVYQVSKEVYDAVKSYIDSKKGKKPDFVKIPTANLNNL
jgi:hypothetical protein